MDNAFPRPDGIYPTIDDWLCEIENYGFRAERMSNEEMLWAKTAWQLATRAEAYRCAIHCRELAAAAPSANERRTLTALADKIWKAAPDDVR